MGNRTLGSLVQHHESLGSARLACRHRLAAALGAGTLLLGIGAAHAESINSCPVTITKPGHYSLNKDLVCTTNGNAITISAGNVVLDLKGHILLGPHTGASTSTGVYVGSQQNVVVENGTITGFATGVWLQGSTFSQVTGIAARGNSQNGIVVWLGHNNAVSGCDASHSGGFGIVCVSTVTTITNNTANSSFAGITDFGTLNTIQGNTANSNVADGIGLHGTFGMIQGNTAELNVVGFLVSGTGYTIQANTALGNSFIDLDDGHANCDSNNWLNNTFVTRNQPCIH